MALRSRVLAITAFLFSGLAMCFIIASFASPYWVETDKKVNPSGFERMGLWEACFRNYYPIIRPITTKKYDGCWPALSFEMAELYDHFYPAWMRGVQAMMTLAMLQEVGSVVLNITYFLHCFTLEKEQMFVLISSILNFISAFFCTISAIMFGVQVDNDRQWLPQPDSNFLSWSFGFCILGGIFCLFSGMCGLADYFRLRAELERDRPDRPVHYAAEYRMPPPKYRY